MKTRIFACIGVMALAITHAAPAPAYMNPYVRIGYGANQMKMSDANDAIATEVGWAQGSGIPVSPKTVGAGYGPSLQAGLWLFPGLRVGAIYGTGRSRVTHEYSVPSAGYLYSQDYEFKMTESGLEAAVRIPQLRGFTFGGSAAEAKSEFLRSLALENVHGRYYEDGKVSGTTRTYSAFAGFDQVLTNGVAGFLQFGYHWRDVGSLPGENRVNNNGTITDIQVDSVDLDFSGWSVRAGLGYDLNW